MAIGDKKSVLMQSDINAPGGVAPAGYGLGDDAQLVDSANNITKTGFYATDVGTPNTWDWSIFHIGSRDRAVQYGYSLNDQTSPLAVRQKVGGVWGEWEWVNPPVAPGVEYRTTERYMGKPVYTKLINIGKLTNNAEKSDITITGDGKAAPIRIDLLLGGDANTQGTAVGNNLRYMDYIYTAVDQIILKPNADLSSTYARVQVWYTKS